MNKSQESKSSNKSSAKPAAKASAKPATTAPEIANLPAITTAEVDAFVDAIDTFAELLGAGFVVPQPKDMQRLPKARKDASVIVPTIADLSNRYQIASTAYPMDVTLAKQQLVATLTPLAERIAAVQKLVSTVMTVGQSGAWEGAMVTYGLLKNEARGNAVLRNALSTVREKLRPTYETEDGGKTKKRSRAKQGATAKEAESPPAEATPAPPATATAPATASSAPAVEAPKA